MIVAVPLARSCLNPEQQFRGTIRGIVYLFIEGVEAGFQLFNAYNSGGEIPRNCIVHKVCTVGQGSQVAAEQRSVNRIAELLSVWLIIC